jgi:hypothetical protein
MDFFYKILSQERLEYLQNKLYDPDPTDTVL